MPSGLAGNDWCGNPQWNPVLHPYDPAVVDGSGRPTQRGVPVLHKVVTNTATGTQEICTATTPDADKDGGGTWTVIGGGSGGSAYVDPDVILYEYGTTTVVPLTSAGTWILAAVSGGSVHLNGWVLIDTGWTPTACEIVIPYLAMVQSPGLLYTQRCGFFTHEHSGTLTKGWTQTSDAPEDDYPTTGLVGSRLRMLVDATTFDLVPSAGATIAFSATVLLEP